MNANVKNKNLIGQILINNKVITKEQLQEALVAQEELPLRIGQLLIKRGVAKESDVLKALAEQYDVQYKDSLHYLDTDKILSIIPSNFLKRNKIVPFNVSKNIIQVALEDILKIQPLDDLKMLFPDYTFEPVICPSSEIQRLIQTVYETLKDESTDDVIENLKDSDEDFELLTSINETTDLMDDMANDAPIIKLVNTIIKQAVADNASDIHIEPYEKDLVVRFRLDGILYEMFDPPKKFQNAIISRIKIMSNLNIAENRLPQDGRIEVKVGGKDVDIRVSSFPTYYGERIVMRLLNKSDMSFDLESIGFDKKTFERFNKIIAKTNGIVLVTGPTGSGKSTTLYGVLSKLNKPEVNILTVEDPIEYQLHGIGQMQVKSNIDLTFASGLRSILRQDPDIVMIGEIRDVETAQIAIQAALTGHLVFSTLHTNDAASGVTRFIDMGVEPFLIASTVNAFLAQRLVRKICPNCKEAYKPTQKMLSELGLKPSQLKGGKLYHGKGCSKCINTGYAGRLGIYELLTVSTSVRKLIMAHADSEQIKDLAIKEGMNTLLMDGLNKAIDGITTVEEVLRVS